MRKKGFDTNKSVGRERKREKVEGERAILQAS
jgi:hypothetical protein